MPISKAQQKAVNKYVSRNYDRLNIFIPKGQKSTIEAAAKASGESLNQFVQRAVLDRLGLDEWPTVPMV